ncbi:hypothetical protein [Salinivirga cyanobacteriivorans]|nr:hypothetical protein [Salinivirga cyanobacteriivorans]
MKKIYVIIVISMATIFTSYAQDRFDFTLQTGYPLSQSVSGSLDYEMQGGVPPVFFETHWYFLPGPFLNNLGIGAGFGFHHMKTEDPDIGWLWTYGSGASGALFYWPVYTSFKYRIPVNTSFIPYFKFDTGYTFFDAEESIMWPDDRDADSYVWGGAYIGLSAGITLARIINIELNYNILNSAIGTDYRYSGYWQYWEEEYTAKVFFITAGICL